MNILSAIDKKKLIGALLGFLLACFFVSAFIYFFSSRPKPLPENNLLSEAPCSDCVRRFLDGVYVKRGQEKPLIYAAVVENFPLARPQSGLTRAALVYEAEAEGGITRFLAFFPAGADIGEIGPVRSARPYFLDWAGELSALLVHVGGSPEALARIAREKIFNLNEFYQGGYFWRSSDRPAPHNVYTDSRALEEYAAKSGAENSVFLSWAYKEDALLADRPEEAVVKINFPDSAYAVEWHYDRGRNDYVRYTDGELDYDRENNEEIRVKNVIVAYTPLEVIDDVLRIKLSTVGEGDCLVCRDGNCEEGRWQKPAKEARAKFYKESGEEFSLNAGVSWVEIVRPALKAEFFKR